MCCGVVTWPGVNPESEGEAWSPSQSCGHSTLPLESGKRVASLLTSLWGLLVLELKGVDVSAEAAESCPVTTHWGQLSSTICQAKPDRSCYKGNVHEKPLHLLHFRSSSSLSSHCARRLRAPQRGWHTRGAGPKQPPLHGSP